MGAAYVDDAEFALAGRNPLDLLRVQDTTTNNAPLTENPVLGSAVLGTGSWPSWDSTTWSSSTPATRSWASPPTVPRT